MPVTVSYPGVYVEEIPSGVRTITGVSTSVAAFVDFFRRGPMNQAVQIFSFADFERTFGGLDRDSEASYAIQQFFLNGGTEAWVVRVASGTAGPPVNNPTRATAILQKDTNVGGATALTATAASEGTWGNYLRAAVDWPATGLFNLTLSEIDPVSGSVRRQESFRGLSMATVQDVVNRGSQLATVTPSGTDRPYPTGTVSEDIPTAPALTLPGNSTINVSIDTVPAQAPPAQPVSLGAAPITSLEEAASRLQAAIRAAQPVSPAWAQATVRVLPSAPGQQQLQVTAGLAAPEAIITFAGATATTLKLAGANVHPNVAAYSLGSAARGAQGAGTPGADGVPPDSAALLGSQLIPKTGLYALDEAPLFNILCLPRVAQVSGPNHFDPASVDATISAATAYCESRRAFLVLDTPSNVTNLSQVQTWITNHATLRHKNVAFYFPRVELADPLDGLRLRSFGASGTVAGLYARTDAGRGVWKAPAGTEAVLRGVQQLDYSLTNAENGALNPLGINCLRNFPVYGTVSWGARTLLGDDRLASEWKYVPVRRLALYLEESLYRGTQWVVFEPNDEPLWAQIRLNIGAFLHDLFRQGAFQGKTPREAYFVKCDKETTTQNDVNLGKVNIVVGFAPLKPAEFVILQIQQIAGSIET